MRDAAFIRIIFDVIDDRFGQLDLVFGQSGGGNDATEMGFMLVGTDRDEIDALPIVMPRHSGGGDAILLSKKIFHSRWIWCLAQR